MTERQGRMNSGTAANSEVLTETRKKPRRLARLADRLQLLRGLSKFRTTTTQLLFQASHNAGMHLTDAGLG